MQAMVMKAVPYKVQSFGISDIGLVRQNNEDAWDQVPRRRFYVLADGMGGHQAGEVASQEAVNSLCRKILSNPELASRSIGIEEARRCICEAIEEANSHVYQLSKTNTDHQGMGTTLCCLYFHRKGVIYGHVGDSRIYRFRENTLLQLTRDHSLLRELVDMGQLNEEQASNFPHKNIITKALGTEPNITPPVRISTIANNDIYMMCSDGLSDLLKHEEIEAIMSSNKSLKERAQILVDLAKEHGGNDNVTVVMVKVYDFNEEKDLSR